MDTYAIGVFNSSYVNVTENILNVSNCVRSSEPFATLTAISVQGSVANDVLAHDILISSNDITVENPQYKYGITVLYNTQNINITNNNIYGSANNSKAIELYFTNNTSVNGNEILIYGLYTKNQ